MYILMLWECVQAMADSWELQTICDRMLNHTANEDDIAQLRQFLTANSDTYGKLRYRNTLQIGKYNVNIVDAQNIHIGDKVYQGINAETISTILREVLSQNTQHIEIDWHDISQTMLSEQQRLTTNLLTSGEGISYRTEQVYVPLGLVERKKPTRRREDVSPKQGSELYRETEITQTFEHQQFLERVLKHRQSPKSQGKRIAIIGEPGAGKTTLLQQIAGWVSGEIPNAVVIWVSLADLQGRELEAYLFEVWLQAVARKVGQAEASTQIKDDFVAQFNRGLVWLLLDGVDEMQATVGNSLVECDRQLRTGTLLQQARIVLSCRLNLWDGGSNALDSFDNYRTLEFSYPQQVEQFIGNWFGSLPSAEIQTGQRFCEALGEPGKERIRDLAKNPLRLTLLCFNWYLGEGKLPETKAGLYEQFVADFYEWKKGQFATTGEQRKRLNAALGELAREAIDKEATRFRLRQDFLCEYLGEPNDKDSLFALALRLGWLNKVGVDGDNPRKGVYAFFHPTFQEYFAALAQILNAEQLKTEVFAKFWMDESWYEVLILMVGMLEAKVVGDILKYLIETNDDDYLFFAADCLAEVKKRHLIEEIDRKILESLKSLNHRRFGKAAVRQIVYSWRNSKETFPWLINLAALPGHWQLRAAALESLAKYWSEKEETLNLLRKIAFSDEEQGTRSVAVKELSRLSPDSPDILPLLKTIVTSKNYIPYFTAAALDTLAVNYPDDPDTFSLLYQFANSNEHWDIRGVAVQQLAEIYSENQEVLSLIMNLAQSDTDESIRAIAIQALVKNWTYKPEIFKTLCNCATNDPYEREHEGELTVRHIALEAILKNYSQEMQTLVILRDRAENDSDESLRRFAQDNLSNY